MDTEARLSHLETRVQELSSLESQMQGLHTLLTELKQGQSKIANALLGDLGEKQVGLIEEVRNIKKDLRVVTKEVETHQTQINELLLFKYDIKKIVVLIAACIPFLFELGKYMWACIWEVLKKS